MSNEINTDIEIMMIQECPLCYEQMESKVDLHCGHTHCLMCHTNFIKNDIKNCAFCRQEIKSLVECLEHIEIIKSSVNVDINFSNNNISLEKYKLCLRIFCLLILIFIFAILVSMDGKNNCNNSDSSDP